MPHLLYDGLHLRLETQFERLIKLIYDEGLHLPYRHISLGDMVQHATRCGYYHLWTQAFHAPMLIHGSTASIAGHDATFRTQTSHHVSSLDGQLTRGHQHQCLQTILIGHHPVQDRQQISQGLA